MISHEDIGSIIYYGDEENDNLDNIGILDDINRYDPAFRVDESNWLYAKPYTDPVKLHFKPFIATKDSRPPSELGEGTWVAMLMNTGDIQITDDPYTYCWESATYVNEMIVGYQVLSFVNPVLGE
jgi:hypothetical protein